MHRRVTFALITVAAAMAVAGCGSDSVASGPPALAAADAPAVTRPNDAISLDAIVSAGWKKSKQLSADTLPGADEVWYGFFDQKDIEIRLYASHADALALGVGPAEEAVGRLETNAEAGGKLDQSRSRTGYDAFIVVGNVVMLCELDISTCEALINELD